MAKRGNKHTGGLPPDKYLSDDQLKTLLRYVKDRADLARQRGSTRAIVDELIITLLINTGLRASELCSLNIGDLPAAHGKEAIWIRNGKGKVSRAVEVSPKVVQKLNRFVKLYRKGAEAKDPLLISERGKRFIYMSLYSKIKKIGEKASLSKLHPHMLRHTYLVRLYNVEHDLRFVQDQAGHASPTTTAIYAKTDNKARKRQLAALDNNFI